MKALKKQVALAMGATLLIAGPALAQEAGEFELPAASDLLVLAFPKWLDETAGRVQTVKLSSGHPEWSGAAAEVLPASARKGKPRLVKRAAPAKAMPRTQSVIVEPAFVSRLGEKRYVLIARLSKATADGMPESSHGMPVALAAYTFETSKNGWKLVQRQEPLAYVGYESQADIQPLQLSAQRMGLSASYGSCWQGHCNEWLSLYEFGKDKVNPAPILELQLNDSNAYSLPDCLGRLQEVVREFRGRIDGGYDEPDASHDCVALRGDWSVSTSAQQPGDITVRYTGAVSEGGKHGVQTAAEVDQLLRLQYRNGKYLPVAGRSPIAKPWR
ncbi:hypothetical protein [Massilia sp. NR 4-1]|uniref:hypothetical protein n=1 Tax=Massilia sp. NR 4-1 TaxID=1678028 RepID=UPI00067D8E15|nr:hypothetical protein [Massilia sp. NR 4-1]AKU20273.1 hypothetical protein ACZ75_00725 [Massilia sp. NR 4-1]